MTSALLLCVLAMDGTQPAPVGADLLTPLHEGEARVWSEKPAGRVKAKAGRKTIDLGDGETVKFLDDNGGAGMGEDTVASIFARNIKMKLPNPQVITEERLHRSPDGRWAVFSALTTCGDFCYAAGWLFGPGLRLLLSKADFGTDVVAAWRPDGKEVAVGSRELFLVSLPDAQVIRANDFCAPAYSPDGRLFVRGCGASDAVFEWVRGGKPRKVLAARGKLPQSDPESPTDFGDPSPVSFEPDGSLVAEFFRGDDNVMRRLAFADIGKDGKSTPMSRPEAVDKAVAMILDEAIPALRAGRIARAQGDLTPAFARELAVAANTRGYRLYQAGKLDEAIAPFEAAAGLDVSYGMPRYNLARVYAQKGDAKDSVVYLRMLRVMGKPQRQRLEQARRDEAFKKISDNPEFESVFR